MADANSMQVEQPDTGSQQTLHDTGDAPSTACRFCASTKNHRNYNHHVSACTFQQHPETGGNNKWCSACQGKWRKEQKNPKPQAHARSQASEADDLPNSKKVKHGHHGAEGTAPQSDQQQPVPDTGEANIDYTSINSRSKLDSLSHAQLLSRARNLSADRLRLVQNVKRLEKQNAEYHKENVQLKLAAGGSNKAKRHRELAQAVDEAEDKMEGEGFKRGTFYRIALAIVLGILSPHSVVVHYIGDLGRNIHNAATSTGWRWSELHKRFWAYICLVSKRAYRAVRGGEGLRLGRNRHKPVSVLNMIVPGVTTMDDAAAKADPDPGFRDGFSRLMAEYVLLTCAALLPDGTAQALRLGFDGTHIRGILEFIGGKIYGLVDYVGCARRAAEIQAEYGRLCHPLGALWKNPEKMKDEQREGAASHCRDVVDVFLGDAANIAAADKAVAEVVKAVKDKEASMAVLGFLLVQLRVPAAWSCALR